MKFEFKGTKGSWKLDDWKDEELDDSYHSWLILSDKDNQICRANSRFLEYHENATQETIDANAHLISAAPELLQACIDMTNYCNKHNVIELVPEYEQMIAAIHKALNIQP